MQIQILRQPPELPVIILQQPVNENTFVATGISLAKGTNQITATAVDPKGNTKTAEITIETATAYHPLVELDTDITSGAAPLEITFYIEYDYPEVPAKINSAAMDWDGDAEDDYIPTTTEFTHTYTVNFR